MHRLLLTASVPALALVLLACGGSSSPARTAAPSPVGSVGAGSSATTSPAVSGARPDDARAQAMLIRVREDLPNDWLERRHSVSTGRNPLEGTCAEGVEASATGRAVSGDFAFDGESPILTEVVLVYADVPAAAAILAEAPALVECAVRGINEGRANGDDVAYANATSAPLTVAVPADESAAFEVRASGTSAGASTPTLFPVFTLVFARKGRVVYELFINGASSFALDELEDFVAAAGGRVTQ